MAQPYVGEIRMFGGNFAPAGWMFCAGQLLPISENETLFLLIGTTYGGDGQSTFALPNLAARVPLCSDYGSTFPFGQLGGVEHVTLSSGQMPVHSHPAQGTANQGSSASPANSVPASLTAAGTARAYGTRPPTGSLNPASIQPVGGNQPHDN